MSSDDLGVRLGERVRQRFLRHVDQSGECWLWTAAYSGSGYGQTRDERQRTVGAHRLAWRMTYGEPDTLYVLHRCDVKGCVRPSHLFLGTAKDNASDCASKGRVARGSSLNHPSQHGERNHNAKLSNEAVAEMRRLFDLGEATQADLMRRFETTRANVHMIVRRKSRVADRFSTV